MKVLGAIPDIAKFKFIRNRIKTVYISVLTYFFLWVPLVFKPTLVFLNSDAGLALTFIRTAAIFQLGRLKC